MAVKIVISEVNSLLSRITSLAGKDFLAEVSDKLDKFLQQYKARIFNFGKNSANKQLPDLKAPRPKFAIPPGKKRKMPVPFREAPPYLYRTGTLFKSISIGVKRGKIVITIAYDEKVLSYIEDRYGKVFNPTTKEINALQELIISSVSKQLLQALK